MTEWIVSSAVLIIVVALLRQVLKGRISLRLQYALWALVLIRLLVPVTIGQSGFSVATLLDRVPEEQMPSDITISIPPSKFEYEWVLQLAPDLAPVEPDPSLSEEERQQQYEENWERWKAAQDAAWQEYKAENTTTVTFELEDIMLAGWCAGIGVVTVCFCVSNVSFFLRLRRSRRKLEVESCPLPVYLSEAVETPCLFGLFRPAVYVTAEVTEDEKAIAHVLAHETTHYRHLDHVWAFLRCVCLAVHWFNPLVWLAASLSRRDAELACDEGAIRRIGEDERAAYGRTLIDLTCARRGGLLHTATTMTGSKKSIKERIRLIAKKPKMAVYTLIAVMLIAAVAVGCTFTGAEESGGQEESGQFPQWLHTVAEESGGQEESGQFPQWLHTVAEEELSGVVLYYTPDNDTAKHCELPQASRNELIGLFHGVSGENCRLAPDRFELLEWGYWMTVQHGRQMWQFNCNEADGTVILGVSLLSSYYGGERNTYIIDSPELYDFIVTNVE